MFDMYMHAGIIIGINSYKLLKRMKKSGNCSGKCFIELPKHRLCVAYALQRAYSPKCNLARYVYGYIVGKKLLNLFEFWVASPLYPRQVMGGTEIMDLFVCWLIILHNDTRDIFKQINMQATCLNTKKLIGGKEI